MAQTQEEKVLSHRRAVAEYDKQNSLVISLKLNRKTEADIIEALPDAGSGDRQRFIKTAIRAAMAPAEGPEKPEKAVYCYGMRARYFSIGTQPKEGLLGAIDSPDRRWYNVVCYSRRLTADEVRDYELDDING